MYNPLTWDALSSQAKLNPVAHQANSKLKQLEENLFIPGTGLRIKQLKPQHVPKTKESQIRCDKNKSTPESEQDLTLNGFSYPCMRHTDSSQHSTQLARNLKFSRHVKGLALVLKAPRGVLMRKGAVPGLQGLSINGNTD